MTQVTQPNDCPIDCRRFDLPLQTRRLIMQPLDIDQFDSIYALCTHPDTCRYIRPAMTREQVIEHIETRQRPWLLEDGTWASMQVCETGKARVIGEVVFRMASRDAQCMEIGYRFHPDVWGRGYASEAMQALMDLLVRDLSPHKLIAYCNPENTASIKLLTRLGMQQEGLLRDHQFVFGQWTDTAVFGLLCADHRPAGAP